MTNLDSAYEYIQNNTLPASEAAKLLSELSGKTVRPNQLGKRDKQSFQRPAYTEVMPDGEEIDHEARNDYNILAAVIFDNAGLFKGVRYDRAELVRMAEEIANDESYGARAKRTTLNTDLYNKWSKCVKLWIEFDKITPPVGLFGRSATTLNKEQTKARKAEQRDFILAQADTSIEASAQEQESALTQAIANFAL
jgi:hypothetical protein